MAQHESLKPNFGRPRQARCPGGVLGPPMTAACQSQFSWESPVPWAKAPPPLTNSQPPHGSLAAYLSARYTDLMHPIDRNHRPLYVAGLLVLLLAIPALAAETLTGKPAFGKVVTARVVTRDRYGRSVARVILPDGKDLSAELVEAGLAWVPKKNGWVLPKS